MFHTKACDGEQSVCGCCDCTTCETHNEFAEVQYNNNYDEWVKLQDGNPEAYLNVG